MAFEMLAFAPELRVVLLAIALRLILQTVALFSKSGCCFVREIALHLILQTVALFFESGCFFREFDAPLLQICESSDLAWWRRMAGMKG